MNKKTNHHKLIAAVLTVAMLFTVFVPTFADTDGTDATTGAAATAAPAASAEPVPSESPVPTAAPSAETDAPTLSTTGFSDVKGTACERAVQRMVSLGIVNGFDDGTFQPEKNVTRAEFATMLTRMMNMDANSMMTGASPFSDVADNHWAAGSIKIISDLGWVNGVGGGKFEPESFVTFEQATKVVMMMLGYDPLIAKPAAGEAWYTGYMVMGAKTGFLKGVNPVTGKAATRGELTIMLDNALEIDMVEETETGRYEIQKNTNLLGSLLYDGAEIKGILQATDKASIVGTTSLRNNQVMIGGYIYDAGTTNARDYIGMQVRFFVKEIDGEDVITGIYPVTGKNNIVELSGADIYNVTSSKVEYYDENDDEQDVSLADGMPIIYNNQLSLYSAETALKNPSAQVRLIDNNDDDVFEVAVIRAFEIGTVQKINAYDDKIYLKGTLKNGKNTIEVRDTNKIKVKLYTYDGQPASLEDFSEEDTICEIYTNEDSSYIEVYKLDETISGTVTQMSGDGYITIDDTEYRIEEDATGFLVSVNDIFAGNEYVFTLSRGGKIVYADENLSAGNYKFGYVYAMDNRSGVSSITKDVKLKIVTGSTVERVKENDKYYMKAKDKQVISTLELADKVRVNNVSVTSDKVLEKIEAGRVIKYTTNGEGKISKIETCQYNSTPELTKRSFNAEQLVFGGSNGGSFGIDEDTVVFFLPKGTDEYDFYAEMKFTTGTYETIAFDKDSSDFSADAVVFQTDIDSNAGQYFAADEDIKIVQNVTEGINENGESYYRVSGYSNGEPFDLKSSPRSDAANAVLADVKIGDIIYYTTDFDGYINSVEKIQLQSGSSKVELSPSLGYYKYQPSSDTTQVYGIVTQVKGKYLGDTDTKYTNRLLISTNKDASGAEEYKMSLDENNMSYVYIYDYKKGDIIPAEIEDIQGSDTVGIEDASRVFLYSRNSTTDANQVAKIAIIVR